MTSLNLLEATCVTRLIEGYFGSDQSESTIQMEQNWTIQDDYLNKEIPEVETQIRGNSLMESQGESSIRSLIVEEYLDRRDSEDTEHSVCNPGSFESSRSEREWSTSRSFT